MAKSPSLGSPCGRGCFVRLPVVGGVSNTRLFIKFGQLLCPNLRRAFFSAASLPPPTTYVSPLRTSLDLRSVRDSPYRDGTPCCPTLCRFPSRGRAEGRPVPSSPGEESLQCDPTPAPGAIWPSCGPPPVPLPFFRRRSSARLSGPLVVHLPCLCRFFGGFLGAEAVSTIGPLLGHRELPRSAGEPSGP